jgi:hypothetical protein
VRLDKDWTFAEGYFAQRELFETKRKLSDNEARIESLAEELRRNEPESIPALEQSREVRVPFLIKRA